MQFKKEKKNISKEEMAEGFSMGSRTSCCAVKKDYIYYTDKYILSPRRHRAAFNTKRHTDSDGVLDQDTPAGKRKRFALMQ